MGCENVAARLTELCNAGGISTDLSHYGLKASDWPEVLAALTRYGSHRQSNPVEVTDEYARELFDVSLGGTTTASQPPGN